MARAIRPCFYATSEIPYIKSQNVEFEYFSGFARSQKEKSIKSFLNSAKISLKSDKVLEISKASPMDLGRNLSAFNLNLTLINDRGEAISASVERFFQGSKVFEHGGPYHEIIYDRSIHPKKYHKLKSSGIFVGFELFGKAYATEPKTYFYDWLYLNALLQNQLLGEQVVEFEYFSDIEFNPKKSFSSQSKSVALYSAMKKYGLFEENFKSPEAFLKFMRKIHGVNSLFG
ncbi:MAG: hypothetical protein J6M21_00560 [Campylobacter sp.]|nr:hypothetical protein [Campylobacter sp.]